MKNILLKILKWLRFSDKNQSIDEPYYPLSPQQYSETKETIGTLLREKHSLEQSLRTQEGERRSENEQIYLEIIDIIDTLEPLLKHIENSSNLDEKTLKKRLPKVFRAIHKKLLAVLKKRQVEPIRVQEGDVPDYEKCRVVDREFQESIEQSTITKIVRQGYSMNNEVLRAIDEPYYQLSPQQYSETKEKIGTLLREKHSLEQSLRNQEGEHRSENEQIYLEIIDIIDTLEPLLKHIENSSNLDEKTLKKRLPKVFRAIHKKLLAVLKKRQVEPIRVQEGDVPDYEKCRVVDREFQESIEQSTITKIVRQGYSMNNKVLRAIEVIIASGEYQDNSHSKEKDS